MSASEPPRGDGRGGPASSGRTVLVTGGAGFLGGKVLAALRARGAGIGHVIVADLHPPLSPASTGPAPTNFGPAPTDFGPGQPPAPEVTYAPCDVTDPQSVAAVFAAHSIEAVVHLAAIVNPGNDPGLEYRVDVEGAQNVLSAAAGAGVERVVVSSSGAAYGYHADNPEWLSESDPLRGNEEFPYSRHKRLVEEMLASYRATHPQMTQTILRIGTILGPGVENQITRLWNGRRLLHISGSDSPFVFIWVDDVAQIIARAAAGGPAGVYNVAGDGVLTVGEIAARLGKKLLTVPAWALTAALGIGRALRLTEHGPEKVRFLRYRPVLDNTALKEGFGYIPTRTSAEAFEEFLDCRGSARTGQEGKGEEPRGEVA